MFERSALLLCHVGVPTTPRCRVFLNLYIFNYSFGFFAPSYQIQQCRMAAILNCDSSELFIGLASLSFGKLCFVFVVSLCSPIY